MAAQKHPTPAARVRRSKVSDAVAATAAPQEADKVSGQSDMDIVYYTVKKDGKDVVETLAVARSVLATISLGMKLAVDTETTWQKGATGIIHGFYGEAIPKLPKADLVKWLREHAMFDAMYQVFQQRHPLYTATMDLLEKSKVGGKDGDVFKSAYNNDIGKIRTTASSQAVRVVGFYAAEHAADKAPESRVQETARSLIEAARKEWANRILTGRGNFGETEEKATLQEAIDLLAVALQHETERKAARLAEANKLSLLKPGEVDVGTEEDFEEATAE